MSNRPALSPFYLDLSNQEISELERALGNVLRSGTLILGPNTKRFEAEFAKYIGTAHAVAVNTGTSALEILLAAHHSKGKRVAVPSNTNFASVAAIIRAGGDPVFMDMTKEYFVPNLEILKDVVEKYQVSGVMWVHIGGIIAPDFLDVVAYCRSKGIFLIEDAAHAHGSSISGVKAGALADGGAFSFFPTKVMTTMEGGMITTNDAEVAVLARSMRNQGKRDGDYGGLHYDLGSSLRISEIAACMGLVMLAKLDDMVARRSSAAATLASVLDRLGIGYCRTEHMDQASNYKVIVRLNDKHSTENIKKKLKDEGVVCGGGVYDVPCHLHPVFKDIPRVDVELKTTTQWCPRHICPPITSGTSPTDAAYIADALERTLG